MVKKLKQIAAKKAASSAGLFDSPLAGTVKESAQQIWLAGLGAFAKAQEEGGKVFDALVKEGAALQRKTQGAQDKIGAVASRMSEMAGDVGAKAGQRWDKLETIFEERTAQALAKLGVPSSKDVDELIKRIDALAAQVSKLSKVTPARGAKTAAAKTGNGVRKPTAKRAAARKSA